MRVLMIPVLAALSTSLAVPVRERPGPPDPPDLVGTYRLWHPNAYPLGASTAHMKITLQDGNRFTISIAQPTGSPGVDWQGHGVIDGKRGHYDWVFPNGWTGRTTITIDADGNLRGQVRGSGIAWDYIGKRDEGPVEVPRR